MTATNAVLDIEVINRGSVFLLMPLTDAGKQWTIALDADSWQYFGDAVAVDHRYVLALIDAAIDDGLEIGSAS